MKDVRCATMLAILTGLGTVLALGFWCSEAPAQPKLGVKTIPANLRVRLARQVDPARRITFKGRELTVRQFQEQVPGDELVQLPGGGEAKVQDILDAFEDLKGKAGGSLARIPKRQAFDPARQAHLRGGPGQVHASLRSPKPLKDSKWGAQLVRFRQLPMEPLPPPAPGGRLEISDLSPEFDEAPGGDPLAPNLQMVPAQEPFGNAYTSEYGWTDLFGGYETYALGGEYVPASGNPGVQCINSLEAGIYLFGKTVQVAELRQESFASTKNTSARTGLYLFGQDSPVWSKPGNHTNQQWTKSVSNMQLAEGVIPIHAPFGVHWKALGSGTIGVTGVTASAVRQGTKSTCTAAGTPTFRMAVTFTGTPAVIGPPPKFWSYVEKFVTVGLSGTVVIVDEKVPGRASLSLVTDSKNQPLKLTESASLTSDTSVLSGSITAFARLNLPPEWMWLLAFIDEPPSFGVEKEFFSWTGWKWKDTIANVPSHDIAFVKK